MWHLGKVARESFLSLNIIDNYCYCLFHYSSYFNFSFFSNFSHALNKHFSVKGLQIALEYFEKMGHEVKAVVPMHRLGYAKSSNPQQLKQLHGLGKIVLTPCKWINGRGMESYDDRYLSQFNYKPTKFN